ncbi:MAG TPA: M1 family aminopeptidase [Thermoanaerobaculia bacterium]|nr:M1 family aminopeptidase [Thermoanaerobaculia bacterium]
MTTRVASTAVRSAALLLTGSGALICALICALVSSVACAPESDPIPDPGVPWSLALERAERISGLRYEVALSLPAALDAPVTGSLIATFELSSEGASRPLFLDFAQRNENLLSVLVNGVETPPVVIDQHLHLPAERLTAGANRVEIELIAGNGSLNRSADLMYTLFVPDRARIALPVFDQPDLKARWTLTLEIPAAWRAVANAPVEEEVEILAAGEDRRVLRFAETEPLATYQLAFAAGRFEVESAARGGRTLRMLHRESDGERIARNAGLIFDLHTTALAWLEDYTGIPYPFAKLDFALLPAFQYGGMEHPGSIFYRAEALLLDDTATLDQELRRASLIAHETAHMWFGNLVTMEWFDDVWMKEVFANFMAAKIVHPSFPELDHDLRFLLAHHPAAYRVERTAGANPIRQPLANLADAGSLYGAIIYQKAPIAMRQLERLIGAETFRRGLRAYLAEHRHGNASWLDLIDTLDALSDDDLAAWSEIWVEQAGRAVVRTVLEIEDGQDSELALEQEDPAGFGRLWVQRLRVRAGSEKGGSVGFEVDLDARRVRVAGGLPAPDWVLANGDGEGYARFEPDERTLGFLLRRIGALPDPTARAVGWLGLWDALLEGRVAPVELIETALGLIEAEPDPQVVDRVLSDLEELYWRFLPPATRDQVAPRLERILWERLSAAPEITQKAMFYRALTRVAITRAGVDRLVEAWRTGVAVPGFELSEQDRIALVEQLAVRGIDGADALLEQQRAEIEDPDRRRRFEFILPALGSNAAVREAFALSFADPAQREREPWVLAALSAIHHPLRAPETEHLIGPALELLEEVQRTGDIFFPLAWLEAVLGGHRTQSAAAIVREFLDHHPDLPDRLRGKLLQAADPLFRAAELGG